MMPWVRATGGIRPRIWIRLLLQRLFPLDICGASPVAMSQSCRFLMTVVRAVMCWSSRRGWLWGFVTWFVLIRRKRHCKVSAMQFSKDGAGATSVVHLPLRRPISHTN